jgi:methionine synthase I (cobalamin-dependent)
MGRNVEELIREEYVVLDGGMGTLLQEKGLTPAELPEEWNLLHPDIVEEIHLDYLASGAQIIETNTFGGTSLKLHAKGKEQLVEEVNRKGAQLALSALKAFRSMQRRGSERVLDTGGRFRSSERSSKDERYIAGSMGPTGRIFEMGLTKQQAERAYGEQGVLLAGEGIDLFLVETMLDMREAEVAVRTVKRETGLPVFASAVFSRTKKGEFRTLFGNGIRDSVEHLLDAGASAVGVNCGLIEEYIQVIKEMREITDAPLVLYPNAGLPVLKDGKTVFNQTPEYLISHLEESIAAGATIIGGCCGTTPEYVRLIAERLKGKKIPYVK